MSAGLPVAALAAVRPGERVTVRGTIRSWSAICVGGGPACRCTLTDGTGEIDLLFLGRAGIAGLAAGLGCEATGRAALRDGRTVIWNPWYCLDPRVPGGLGPPVPVARPGGQVRYPGYKARRRAATAAGAGTADRR
jgi:hypothetical protein